MIDVVEQAKKLLEAQGYENVTMKRLDAMTGREGIVLRKLPSTFEGTYQDRSQTLAYLWQVIVRTRSASAGQETAEALAKLLRAAKLPSGNDSYWFISQELYTPVQELELDESLFYAYEFRVRTDILI